MVVFGQARVVSQSVSGNLFPHPSPRDTHIFYVPAYVFGIRSGLRCADGLLVGTGAFQDSLAEHRCLEHGPFAREVGYSGPAIVPQRGYWGEDSISNCVS